MRIRKSYIHIIGELWYPGTGATTLTASDHDLENMQDDDGAYTRESIDNWIGAHSGDFQSVTDWSADLSLSNGVDIEFPFENKKNEFAFSDIMYGELE